MSVLLDFDLWAWASFQMSCVGLYRLSSIAGSMDCAFLVLVATRCPGVAAEHAEHVPGHT